MSQSSSLASIRMMQQNLIASLGVTASSGFGVAPLASIAALSLDRAVRS
jgi:hypothetical protein